MYFCMLEYLILGYVQGKYKVYNLCSERLYDASLFEGKVSHDFSLVGAPTVFIWTIQISDLYCGRLELTRG